MATLSAGHLFTDIGQGSIPALLPFLIVRDHLSYAGASALILAATIASSVIQPVFGHLSDRRSLPWLMPHRPDSRRAGGGTGRRRAHLRAHLRRRRGQRDRRRRLPSRGLALCQLRLRRAALERHEPVQRRRQHRLRAGPGAGDAAGAGLRPLGDAAGDRAHHADGAGARPRAAAPEDLPRRPGHRPGGHHARPTPGVRSRCSRVVIAPALVRLLRLHHLHPAVFHPRPAHGPGHRRGRADGHAGRRGDRHAGRGPAGRSLRAPLGADRLDGRAAAS